MATETRERQAQYAERQRGKGRHRVCFWLHPSVVKELRRCIDAHGGDKQDAANAVFQALLAQTKPKAPPAPAPATAPVMISTTEAARRLYDERELDAWLAAERRKAEEF